MFYNIPQELKKLNRWVCWKKESRKGGPTKVPVNPKTGGRAMSNNPSTWGSFEAALECMKVKNLEGIGFMFNGDGIVGVDIDKCRDPETGILSSEAKDIVSALDSYTEISQSGTGIHIICRGKLPEGKRRKGNVEMYEVGRFFIMTGDILDDVHTEIQERTEQLKYVYDKYLKAVEEKKPAAPVKRPEISLTESEIIRKAMAAQNGEKFAALFNGTWNGLYSSQSEADIALCNMLAFWTGRDAGMMDRIFRQSALYRPKWDEKRGGQSYGEMTIQDAINKCDKIYNPSEYFQDRAPVPKNFQPPLPELLPPEPPPEKESDQLPDWLTGPYNDMWNAERLIEKYGNILKFNKTKGSWYIWNGKQWKEDEKDEIRNLADETIVDLYKYKDPLYSKLSNQKDGEKKYAAFLGWLSRSRNTSRKNNMITEAESWPGISAVSSEFDKEEWLFNCANGTIDLRTGELLPHTKENMITKISHVEYDPDAKAPVFKKFLERIFDGKKHLIDFIQRAVGYSLTGSTREQCVFVCYGSGANGKSTLINIIQEMMGDYARNTNFTTFTVRNDSNTNDIARLMGSRFVTAMEVGEDKRLNEALIKQLSGGDLISARYLHKEFFDFYPTFKIWMGTNHKPKIKETDDGIWRRIKLIPFEVTIPPNERDGELLAKLRRELPGILAWAVKGCLDWQKQGLNPPDEVNMATDTYRSEMDVLQAFLSECIAKKEGAYVKSGDLYKVYTEWCEENGERPFSSTKLSLKLKERGIQKGRTKTMRFWDGIELTQEGKQYLYSKYEGKKQYDDYEQTQFSWEDL